MGASVIAVTPVAQASPRVVETAVTLSAATSTYCPTGATDGACAAPDVVGAATPFAAADPSILNVPTNLFNAIASIPANQIAGLNLFAKSLEDTGSLLVWSPTNVFGFDQADPAKLQSIIDLLIPFPALSTEIGRQSVIWAQANFPVNPGCAALPGACPHPEQILGELLQVPTYQLYQGYTFPTKVNPFDGSDVGYPVGYVKLDPNKPAQDFLDSLLAPPTGVKTVTLDEIGTTFARVGAALFNSFYPFVQNSEYYNPDETGLAYVFRALSPFLCGNCNRDPANGYAGVYDNPYLYENYDPKFPPAVAAKAVESGTPAITPLGASADESGAGPSSLTVANLDLPTTAIPSTAESTPAVVASNVQEPLEEQGKSLLAANLGEAGEDSTEVGGTPAPGVTAPTTTPASTTPAFKTPTTTTPTTTTPTTSTPGNPADGAGAGRGKHWKPGANTSASDKIRSTIANVTKPFGAGPAPTAKDGAMAAGSNAEKAGNQTKPAT